MTTWTVATTTMMLEGGYGADDADRRRPWMTTAIPHPTAWLHDGRHGAPAQPGQAMGGDAEGDTWGDTVTVQYDNPDPEADPEDAVLEETVPDIVHLKGSAMADILAGDSRDNTIEGGGGDDKIYGGPGGGADTLHGDGGDDMLFGGIGIDTLSGGAGDDVLNGGGGADVFYGGPGSDLIYADSTDTTINGWLIQALDGDTDGEIDNPGPYVGPLNDADTADVDESTEAGSDPMAVDTVSFEKLEEGIGASDDIWSLATDALNIENVIGTSENDWIVGDDGDNVIEGGDGADNLDGAGNPTTNPRGDTVSYANSDRRVTVTIDADGTGTASGGHAQGDTIQNFENVTGSDHDDNLTGDETGNVIKGGAGEDRLRGEGGADTIEGGAGADELYGGTETGATLGVDTVADTLSYASSDAGVTVNLATLLFAGGHAEGDEDRGATEYDHDSDDETDPIDISTFENITGSMHNDRLTGDHRVNELKGGAGDDTLRGGAQVDTLIGGPGADSLDGGSSLSAGGDTPNNPDDDVQHIDIASYAGAMAGVTVNLATGRGTAGDAMGDTLSNIEQVVGSDHDDTFIAGGEADNIDGGENPAMDAEGDTVSYELSDEAVQVTLADDGAAQTQAAQADSDSYATGDILANIENITGSGLDDDLTGNNLANKLMGGGGDDDLDGAAGDDKLYGGDGNDEMESASGTNTFMGGAGRDTMTGGTGNDMFYGGTGDDEMTGGGTDTSAGTGADIFVFSPEDGDGDDIINGFTVADDKIDLRAFDLDAEDLVPLISVRGGAIRIDLRSVGGGTIELAGVGDLDTLDDTTVTTGDGAAADDDAINTLSEWSDTDEDGMVDFGEGGVFIL